MTKALELADWADDLFSSDGQPKEIAAMLRKQHEAIKQLRTALTRIERLGNKMDFSAVAEATAALQSTENV